MAIEDCISYEDRLDYSTHILLDILDEFNIRSTFFVLGYYVKKKISLIKEIHQQGHEIASHGYSHKLIYNQSKKEFASELVYAKSICEDIIGQPVLGYRAACWSITKETLWALDVIKECGFIYDSSIFPTTNYLFGIPGSPRFAYKLKNGLLEIPPSTLSFGKRTLPFSGGFFLRLLPFKIIQMGMHSIHKEGHPAMLYFHPWELDQKQPRNLPAPLKNKIIHYVGLRTTEKKLRKLLSGFKFNRIDYVYADSINIV